MHHEFGIVASLLRRDLSVMVIGIHDRFINYTLNVFFQVIIFGYLLPLMGMPPALIGPIFVGNIVFTMTGVTFSRSLGLINDVNFGHHIFYELALPFHRGWLLARYIVSFMLEFLFLSAPLIPLGKFFLGEKLDLSHMRLLPFAGIYLCMLFFFTTFYIAISLLLDFDWYTHNLWPRVLSPFELFGCLFYTWKGAHAFLPFASYVLLLSPHTLIVEGLRGSLLSPEQFLPTFNCILGLLVWSLLSVACAYIGLSRRLDTV